MKLVVLMLFFICSTSFASNEKSLRFTPHISAEAYTQKQWGLSFQRGVGANINTNFLLSSLTIAITNRLEVGTVLTHYLQELHNANISLKYNFWRTDHFMWSVGINSTNYSLDQNMADFPDSLKGVDVGITITALQLLLNYFPEWTDLKFGFNFNIINNRLTGVSKELEELALQEDLEAGIDISKPFKDRFDLTLGFGWLRENGFAADENVTFGFGSSVRWYRPNKIFSSPTVGAHYSPKNGTVDFLLSSSIY